MGSPVAVGGFPAGSGAGRGRRTKMVFGFCSGKGDGEMKRQTVWRTRDIELSSRVRANRFA